MEVSPVHTTSECGKMESGRSEFESQFSHWTSRQVPLIIHFKLSKEGGGDSLPAKKRKSLGRQPTSSPIRSRALPGTATPSLPTKAATAGYSTCPAGSQMERKNSLILKGKGRKGRKQFDEMAFISPKRLT